MPTSSPELIDLLCRWQQQRRLGIPVDVEQLCANAPDLLDALKQQIAALESMERLLGTNLTIDGVDHAGPTVDREATTGGFDAGRTTTPQQASIRSTSPSPPGYEILSELGRGGMGVVYKALQVKAKRIVALKMILSGVHASQSALERFRIEGESIARLQHPNIVQVFDVGEYNRTPYFALEFCDGGNLAKKLAGTPLPGKDAAILVEKLARAVAEAHDKGIIHRDLKPANVLLTVGGEPKVTDFGLAKQLDQRSPLAPREASVGFPALREASVQPIAEREDYTPREEPEDLTHTGAVMGTPSYMAPEQASGDTKRVGPPCDVYALGVILYECLTGRPPFKGLNYVDTLDQVRHQEPVPPSQLNPRVPRDLETICLRCLQKEPVKRYASTSDLANDLRRYLDNRPIVARPVSRLERAVKWVKRNPVITGAMVAVMLALTVGGMVSYAKYLDAKEQERIARLAREEEANRVKERDKVIGERDGAIDGEKTATKNAKDRANDLTYQLGIADVLLAEGAFKNSDANLAAERLTKVPPEMRKWEWHYLKRKVRGGELNLYGHNAYVYGVACSPDGTRIVTGSADNTAKVWNARSGVEVVKLEGHKNAVSSVAYSPDGTRIVTGSEDGGAKVWDARSGLVLVDLYGHSGTVNCVAYSPDGARIVTGSNDKTAKVRDARSGVSFIDLRGHTDNVMSVAFSPDGTRIVTGSNDKTAKVWDARSGVALFELKGHTRGVSSVAFSPDGARIVTGGWDQTAKVWDARSGVALVDLKGHTDGVSSVAFSPDGTRIVTGSNDKTAKVWDARSGVALVDFTGHTDSVRSVAFSPDGTRIVTASNDDTAKVWDARSGISLLDLKGHTNGVNSVAFSPDGTRIVTGSWDGLAEVWDARTGVALVDLKGHRDCVESVACSPDGTWIVTGSWDRTAKIWDARTGMAIVELKGHTGTIWSVAFSPDGTRIVTGSYDKTAKVWDARSGVALLDLKGHTGVVRSVAFSPDGTRIVTGSYDKSAKVWDARSGVALVDLKGHTDVGSVAFSPDGTRIVTGYLDGAAKVWDARFDIGLVELAGHTSEVRSVAFSPDGTMIVTGSLDLTAKVWDARSGIGLHELKGHHLPVDRVAFCYDGTQILTGYGDNTNRMWDARSGRAMKSEPIRPSIHNSRISPDGRMFAHIAGNRVELIPLAFDSNVFSERLLRTRPNFWRYREDYAAAQQTNDELAMRFYLDRELSMFPNAGNLTLRNQIQRDPRLIARASFHHPELDGTPYDRAALRAIAAGGDRWAKRLVAQELLRDGKPQAAIPLLFECMLARRFVQPSHTLPAPFSVAPVEELLLAQAYLDLKQPDDAKRFYRAAVDWLERYERPIQVMNLVSHHALNPWAGLGEAFVPVDDPRRNPFDWESWHECDVFRAAVERRLVGK